MVATGDKIPSVTLLEKAPDAKVDIGKELASGKGVIVGVPAAFSPACSQSHIPGYISSPKLKDAGKVFVVAVNDPFVMKAWAENLDPQGKSGIRFLADPKGEFAKALDVEFTAADIFGGPRNKRFAIVTENGVAKSVDIEPDNIGMAVSTADKVLK